MMINDKSTWSLISANIITVAMAIIWRWSVYDVIFVYWCQSVIIGVFTFHKLLTFSLEPYQGPGDKEKARMLHDAAASKPKVAKPFIAAFFAFHYGLFHLGYLIFIVGSSYGEGNPLDLTGGLLAALFFIINHLYSYHLHKNEDLSSIDESADKQVGESNIGDTFSKPYARIIPIHLTIMAAGFASQLLAGRLFENILVLLIFMGLKTFMDVKAHLKKHRA